MATLGAVDSSHFPEITSDRSSFESPLTAINRRLRRKNAVAAAAVAIPYTSIHSCSDPWSTRPETDACLGGYSLTEYSAPAFCTCSQRQSSIERGCTSESDQKLCSGVRPDTSRNCTARLKHGNLLQAPRLARRKRRMSATAILWGRPDIIEPPWNTRTVGEEDPQHAKALLQATPKLRYLSSSAADMTGGSAGRKVLNFLLPGASEGIEIVSSGGTATDYRKSLARDRANQQSASELATLLFTLFHEMSLEDYGTIESEIFTSVFALVHDQRQDYRMAGLAALDALIVVEAPSADEEKKGIKFANALSNGLRSANGDFEFLSAVSMALGHMATRTANVDFVESEISRALEWLRTERSDRRLAASLALKELAIHASTAFHAKTSQSTLGQGGSNEFLDHIFDAIRDLQPIVRACAADALSQCLKILMERRHPSLTGLLCQVYSSLSEGLQRWKTKRQWNTAPKAVSTHHGSLLVASCMLAYTRDFMLPRFDEVCTMVLSFSNHPSTLIRLEVVRLIPRLAMRCPKVFGRRYLEQGLEVLIQNVSASAPLRGRVDTRPSAYGALGELVRAMTNSGSGLVIGSAALPTLRISEDPKKPGGCYLVELSESGVVYDLLGDIFSLVRAGLQQGTRSETLGPALQCAANLVQALDDIASPYIDDLINDMFRAGLKRELITALHAIVQCTPKQQSKIENRLLQETSLTLAGNVSAKEVCDPVDAFRSSLSRPCRARTDDLRDASDVGKGGAPGGKSSVANGRTGRWRLVINMSDDTDTVRALVLSLQTLSVLGDPMGRVRANGALVSLLPFVKDVVTKYLSHPDGEVRRAAALTTAALLVTEGSIQITSWSGCVVEECLGGLLRVAMSDPSAVVRLCVVRALDSRYDPFLCQAHHLQSLFLLLSDEALATRTASLELIGRLSVINPAPILPVLRRFLMSLIVELRCGVDTGRGREEATRLLVVFLREKSLQRLVHPVLPSLVGTLPLSGAAPRLASAALEALGELACATGPALRPWLKDLVPHILVTMQDQGSASKQRTSLMTLGRIAGATGYVVRPYLDYPELLSRVTDVLPGTKRAPWSLRREVIRCLGVLGALDPDRYQVGTRKGGVMGGAYFEEPIVSHQPTNPAAVPANRETNETVAGVALSAGPNKRSELGSKEEPSCEVTHTGYVDDDDQPAHLAMYEQYAMVVQPVASIPPARRITPSDEMFYPTVVIQALMRIFRDTSLAVHHGMVIQAIMFIFKALGLRCLPFLGKVVPSMIVSIQTCGPSSLRESLLKQMAALSHIVKEHLRPYIRDIFAIVEQFWSSRHLATICVLISKVAVAVPDEFRVFVPRLTRRVLMSLDEMQVAEWATARRSKSNSILKIESEKLGLILRSVNNLRHVLGDYLHMLVPALLKLSDSLASLSASGHTLGWPISSDSTISDLHVLSLKTTSALFLCRGRKSVNLCVIGYHAAACTDYGLFARAVQPLVRLLISEPPTAESVGMAAIETLCLCAMHVGMQKWHQLYHTVVLNAISKWDSAREALPGGISSMTDQNLTSNSGNYEEVGSAGLAYYSESVSKLLVSPSQENPTEKHPPLTFADTLPFGGISEFGIDDCDPYTDTPAQPSPNHSSRIVLNQVALQRAWDVTQIAGREDWDQWMRTLSIQLLREGPNSCLRAAGNLGFAYAPLARELFNASFVSCWSLLSSVYKSNLIHALETAFAADISPEILQVLLNLASFMEHDSEGGLPINSTILADLALKCRAYAKALHFKERQHRTGGADSACVEALININRKLDLHEAALGVLKGATMQLEGGGTVAADFALSDLPIMYRPYEMFYSVIWSTDDVIANMKGPIFLTEKKESWLAKLGSWTEALAVYEQKLSHKPRDFDAIMGCMRCLDASGEWRRVLQLAERSWPELCKSAGSSFHCVRPEGQSVKESNHASARSQRKALRLCAQAAWRLGRWDDLEKFATELKTASLTRKTISATAGARDDFDGSFFTAVLHIHRQNWALAAESIDSARKAMDGRFTALMAESYNRAYPSMVTAQTLAEMEEIIHFQKLVESDSLLVSRHPANRPNTKEARHRLIRVWQDRLAGCRADAEVHASILAVRSLVMGPKDDVAATLKFSDLSRQAEQYKLAERVLLDPLEALNADLNGPVFGFSTDEQLGICLDTAGGVSLVNRPVGACSSKTISSSFWPRQQHLSHRLVSLAGGLESMRIQHTLGLAYIKNLWLSERHEEAMERLARLSRVVDLVAGCEDSSHQSLKVDCWLSLGEWKIEAAETPNSFLPEDLRMSVLDCFQRAVSTKNCGYRAWHAFGLFNFRIALQLSSERSHCRLDPPTAERDVGISQQRHVIAAVNGFVSAISLGTKRHSASYQQAMLNLLTCLFKYGKAEEVAKVVSHGVATIPAEAWLGVLPQLLARIHTKTPSIRSVLHPLLIRLGERHPQAMMYPLSVLLKSPVAERKAAAESLMNSLKAHSNALVEEALIVSNELIRVAILWLELWHEGLEDASRLYFGEGNVSGMLELLLPLHEQLARGPETRREGDFVKSFGQDLSQAHKHLKDYVRYASQDIHPSPKHGAYDQCSRLERQSEDAETAINKAWDIYYTVFRRINKQLPALTKLELDQCSPALSRAYHLELGVPGSYRVDGSHVRIETFNECVQVITSKQRPRKITLRGSNGNDYVYLLKGHEDLRQDERVMQLFGLVNALLVRDPRTKKHDLKIQRYPICCLSTNCGLVGWVPNTDTFHSLIRDYRATKRIALNQESKEMLKISGNFDLLTVMQKVECFCEALRRTTGKGGDIFEILWSKSTNSEEWLERRNTYTRSLAVMSMVGYILGLGDRHPSNLMLDKISGRVLHIDFGDCFEVAMSREKYPERVPFRLTRMLVKAMEISGIEGSYRSTCERTMSVLRGSRDSLVAMLEAFVYDPLISWRLVDLSPGKPPCNMSNRLELNSAEHSQSETLTNQATREDIIGERGAGRYSWGAMVAPADNLNVASAIPQQHPATREGPNEVMGMDLKRARSLQMYNNIQKWAANLDTDNRVASIAGVKYEHPGSARMSIAKSRIERSCRQREILTLMGRGDCDAHEEALNEKALKVIRRVQDKLTGADFPDFSLTCEALDVPEQVQRLIVQATSSENLCQLFIGWCAFW